MRRRQRPRRPPVRNADPVAWLEKLANTQGDDDTTVPMPLRAPEPVPEPARAPTAAPPFQVAPVEAVEAAEPPRGEILTVTNPFDSGVDPIAWLENLARRQGAKNEELTTSIAMDIPIPENPIIDEPGYTAFSFDAPIERRRPAARGTGAFHARRPDGVAGLAVGFRKVRPGSVEPEGESRAR